MRRWQTERRISIALDVYFREDIKNVIVGVLHQKGTPHSRDLMCLARACGVPWKDVIEAYVADLSAIPQTLQRLDDDPRHLIAGVGEGD